MTNKKKTFSAADLLSLTERKFLFRNVNGRFIICKAPDLSNVKRTKKQLANQVRFAEAVKYAKAVMKDPAKKTAFKIKPGESLFHAAVKHYLSTH